MAKGVTVVQYEDPQIVDDAAETVLNGELVLLPEIPDVVEEVQEEEEIEIEISQWGQEHDSAKQELRADSPTGRTVTHFQRQGRSDAEYVQHIDEVKDSGYVMSDTDVYAFASIISREIPASGHELSRYRRRFDMRTREIRPRRAPSRETLKASASRSLLAHFYSNDPNMVAWINQRSW